MGIWVVSFFVYYGECCYECSYTSFCVGINFPSFGYIARNGIIGLYDNSMVYHLALSLNKLEQISLTPWVLLELSLQEKLTNLQS